MSENSFELSCSLFRCPWHQARWSLCRSFRNAGRVKTSDAACNALRSGIRYLANSLRGEPSAPQCQSSIRESAQEQLELFSPFSLRGRTGLSRIARNRFARSIYSKGRSASSRPFANTDRYVIDDAIAHRKGVRGGVSVAGKKRGIKGSKHKLL